MRLVLVALAALAATALTPVSVASGALYKATLTDPRDQGVIPARDIHRVTSRFDTTTGTWSARITFFGRVRPKDNAYLRISLQDDQFTSPCHERGMPLAWFFAWTSPKSDTVGAYVGSRAVKEPPSGKRSYESRGRVLRLSLRDERMVGCKPDNFGNIRLSHRRIYDEAGGAEFHRVR